MEIAVRGHCGGHLPTGVDFLQKTVESKPFMAFDLKVGWKGCGYRKWQRFFNFPTYGVGIYTASFLPKQNVLGRPIALYTFVNAPFTRWKKSSFNYDLGMGLAYNFAEFDPENNPQQTAIGSDRNLYFDAALEYNMQLSRNFDAAVGVNLTHFSNGRIRTPNKGVNLLSINATVKYIFWPYSKKFSNERGEGERPCYIEQDIPEFIGFWEYYIFANGGITTSNQNFWSQGQTYAVGSGGIDIGRHVAHISKITIGLDAFFDSSLRIDYAADYGGTEQVPSSELFYGGVHIGHELMFHRFTLVTQYGRTFRKIKDRGNWYLRVGLRYDINHHLFGRLSLKTPDGFRADFVEWGGGIYLYSGKKSKK